MQLHFLQTEPSRKLDRSMCSRSYRCLGQVIFWPALRFIDRSIHPGRSPFTVHRSAFTVHRSPFGVRRSPFPFGVHRSRSPFGVRRRCIGNGNNMTGFLTHKCYRCPDCAPERRTPNAERFAYRGTDTCTSAYRWPASRSSGRIRQTVKSMNCHWNGSNPTTR